MVCSGLFINDPIQFSSVLHNTRATGQIQQTEVHHTVKHSVLHVHISVLLFLLLPSLQRVANPYSRHARPRVRRFANSALRLWRRSVMKGTCAHSHAQGPINTRILLQLKKDMAQTHIRGREKGGG